MPGTTIVLCQHPAAECFSVLHKCLPLIPNSFFIFLVDHSIYCMGILSICIKELTKPRLPDYLYNLTHIPLLIHYINHFVVEVYPKHISKYCFVFAVYMDEIVLWKIMMYS